MATKITMIQIEVDNNSSSQPKSNPDTKSNPKQEGSTSIPSGKSENAIQESDDLRVTDADAPEKNDQLNSKSKTNSEQKNSKKEETADKETGQKKVKPASQIESNVSE